MSRIASPLIENNVTKIMKKYDPVFFFLTSLQTSSMAIKPQKPRNSVFIFFGEWFSLGRKFQFQ